MEKHNGNYIPPGLHRQQRLRFSLDNIDAQVDTSDGRNNSMQQLWLCTKENQI